MIIFETNISELFARRHDLIFFKNIEEKYKSVVKGRPSSGEIISWQNSLGSLSEVLWETSIDKNIIVLIEYKIPYVNNRIDVVLCGKNSEGKHTALIIELKQWSKVSPSPIKRMVKTNVANNFLMEHPSSQALNYKNDLLDIDKEMKSVLLKPVSFLHNYIPDGIDKLISEYSYIVDQAPLFSSDKNSLISFKKYITDNLSGGISEYTHNTFKNLTYNPGDSFVKRAKKLNKQIDIFFSDINLLGNQKSAFNIIKDNLERNLNIKNKTNVFIIEGASGTGKTIVAIKLFLYFLESLKTYIMFPGTDFRNSMIKLFNLKSNNKIRSIIKNSIKGKNTKRSSISKNEVDLIIVDEAHKLEEKGSFDDVYPLRDIVKKVRNVVLFYDHKQIANVKAWNTMNYLNDNKNINIVKLNLKTQFRSRDGNKFIKWIDNILYSNDPNQDTDLTIDSLEVFDNEENFIKKYDYVRKINQSTRLLVNATSFPWTKKIVNKKIYKDINIGGKYFNWYMPNSAMMKRNYVGFNKLSIPEKRNLLFDFNLDDSRILDSVAYWNTVQGSEFDNVFIYIGPEYFLNKNGVIDIDENLFSKNLNSFRSIKNKNSSQIREIHKINLQIALNQLRILFTRTRKKVYVYSANSIL